jgi:hypothetical protein
MMDKSSVPERLRSFSYYYAILQLFHLTFITRAGIIFISRGQIPFPAQPPMSGWANETIPFLFGMGVVDAVAAGMTLYAFWALISKEEFLIKVWVLSINIALTSAIVFCFGTIPSSAWETNPIGYGILGLVFTPLFVYYVCLMRFWISFKPS